MATFEDIVAKMRMRDALFMKLRGENSGPEGQMSDTVEQRALDKYRRGTANLTFGNIAKAFGLAFSTMGPLAPMSLAGQIYNNPSPFTGFVGPTAMGKRRLAAGMPLNEVQRLDRLEHTQGVVSGAAKQGFGSFGDAGASRRSAGDRRSAASKGQSPGGSSRGARGE